MVKCQEVGSSGKEGGLLLYRAVTTVQTKVVLLVFLDIEQDRMEIKCAYHAFAKNRFFRECVTET